MKILEIVNFDDFPEEIGEDETIKQVMSIGEHIWIATERSLYIMLEDDEDFPPKTTKYSL